MPALVTPKVQQTWRKLTFSHPSAFMNLALEEAMARAFSASQQDQPTVRFWTNPRAVVVGRFQETSEEVDLALCDSSGIQVARRFTGGGTVYHDEATLNFTILRHRTNEFSILGFQDANLQLVVKALDELGVPSVSTSNSILIAGRKVCGAAVSIGMHFALWHCSILVDTDTHLLEAVLSPSKSAIRSRFVHSRWQPVTTLSTALSQTVTLDHVSRSLERSLERTWGLELEAGKVTREEERYSEALYKGKYSSDEWNLKGNRGLG